MAGKSPWSVKGIAPEARALAKAAAQREGLTLGVWLSRQIEMAAEADAAEARPAPRAETPKAARPAPTVDVRALETRLHETLGGGLADRLEAGLAPLRDKTDKQAAQIEAVDASVKELIGQLNARIGRVAERADRADTGVTKIADALESVDARSTRLESALADVAEAVAGMGRSVGAAEAAAADAAAAAEAAKEAVQDLETRARPELAVMAPRDAQPEEAPIVPVAEPQDWQDQDWQAQDAEPPASELEGTAPIGWDTPAAEEPPADALAEEPTPPRGEIRGLEGGAPLRRALARLSDGPAEDPQVDAVPWTAPIDPQPDETAEPADEPPAGWGASAAQGPVAPRHPAPSLDALSAADEAAQAAFFEAWSGDDETDYSTANFAPPPRSAETAAAATAALAAADRAARDTASAHLDSVFPAVEADMPAPSSAAAPAQALAAEPAPTTAATAPAQEPAADVEEPVAGWDDVIADAATSAPAAMPADLAQDPNRGEPTQGDPNQQALLKLLEQPEDEWLVLSDRKAAQAAPSADATGWRRDTPSAIPPADAAAAEDEPVLALTPADEAPSLTDAEQAPDADADDVPGWDDVLPLEDVVETAAPETTPAPAADAPAMDPVAPWPEAEEARPSETPVSPQAPASDALPADIPPMETEAVAQTAAADLTTRAPAGDATAETASGPEIQAWDNAWDQDWKAAPDADATEAAAEPLSPAAERAARTVDPVGRLRGGRGETLRDREPTLDSIDAALAQQAPEPGPTRSRGFSLPRLSLGGGGRQNEPVLADEFFEEYDGPDDVRSANMGVALSLAVMALTAGASVVYIYWAGL